MRILWLKTELLHPVDRGGKIRTYHMLRELQKHHHVIYLALDEKWRDESAEAAFEYCHELIRIPHSRPRRHSPAFYLALARNVFSTLPYAMAPYRSKEMSAAIGERIDRGDVDLVVCDFLFPSVNIPEGLDVPKVLFQHNVESEIWRRHYQVETRWLRKAYFREQWRRIRRGERLECLRYDRVIAVSHQDRRLMEEMYGLSDVTAVPTGVDTEYFTPSGEIESRPKEIVFTGSMDWLPNQDAVEFFLDEVLPLVQQTVPEVRFKVVGRQPPQDLLRRAERDDALEVTGFVNDVRPHTQGAGVFVVPIRIGGGTRLKIFEAMAMGLPVVSTSVGAEGLDVVDGRELLIADTAEDMARALDTLLSQPERAQDLASRGAERVRRDFSWQSVTEVFIRQLDDIVERKEHASRGGFSG